MSFAPMFSGDEVFKETNAAVTRSWYDFSRPTMICAEDVFARRCAMAAEEFLGEMGKHMYPARSMPTIVVK